MKKNNNNSALELEIELLKNNLLGKTYKMNQGVKLEEMFNYMIQQKEKGGDCLKSLNDDPLLFNNKQNPRNIEVDMIGLVLVKNGKNINEESTHDSKETTITNKEQFIFEILKYEFHPKKNEKIELNYKNSIKIKYNIKKMKLSPEKAIKMDLCEKLKEIGKIKKSDSRSRNVFEKAQSLINQGGEAMEKINKYKLV